MSQSTAISAALETAMQAASPTSTVKKRKKPGIPPGFELAAGGTAIVICVADNTQTTRASSVKVLRKYRATLTLVTNGGAAAGEDTDYNTLRETIQKKLCDYSIYSTVTGFNDVEISGTPFNQSALNANLNYSTFTADIETLENRT